ncbi:hypothetical protein MRX96_019793 [Rhipicephalus microplus]
MSPEATAHRDSTSFGIDSNDSTSQGIDSNEGGADVSTEDAMLKSLCVADHYPDVDLAEFIKTNSEKMLPNQGTSLLQSILLVLSFVTAARLTWTQVDGLLKLLVY